MYLFLSLPAMLLPILLSLIPSLFVFLPPPSPFHLPSSFPFPFPLPSSLFPLPSPSFLPCLFSFLLLPPSIFPPFPLPLLPSPSPFPLPSSLFPLAHPFLVYFPSSSFPLPYQTSPFPSIFPFSSLLISLFMFTFSSIPSSLSLTLLPSEYDLPSSPLLPPLPLSSLPFPPFLLSSCFAKLEASEYPSLSPSSIFPLNRATGK